MKIVIISIIFIFLFYFIFIKTQYQNNENFYSNNILTITNRYVTIAYPDNKNNYQSPNLKKFILGIKKQSYTNFKKNPYYKDSLLYVGNKGQELNGSWLINSLDNSLNNVFIYNYSYKVFLSCDNDVIYAVTEKDNNCIWSMRLPNTTKPLYTIQNKSNGLYLNTSGKVDTSKMFIRQGSNNYYTYTTVKLEKKPQLWLILPQKPKLYSSSYTNKFSLAVETCKRNNLKLCSLDTIRKLSNNGYSACSCSWTSNRSGKKALTGYPMSYTTRGCGSGKKANTCGWYNTNHNKFLMADNGIRNESDYYWCNSNNSNLVVTSPAPGGFKYLNKNNRRQHFTFKKCKPRMNPLGGSNSWYPTNASINNRILRNGDIIAIYNPYYGKTYDCAWNSGCSMQPFPPPGGNWGTPYRIYSTSRKYGESILNTDTIYFDRMWHLRWDSNRSIQCNNSNCKGGSTRMNQRTYFRFKPILGLNQGVWGNPGAGILCCPKYQTIKKEYIDFKGESWFIDRQWFDQNLTNGVGYRIIWPFFKSKFKGSTKGNMIVASIKNNSNRSNNSGNGMEFFANKINKYGYNLKVTYSKNGSWVGQSKFIYFDQNIYKSVCRNSNNSYWSFTNSSHTRKSGNPSQCKTNCGNDPNCDAYLIDNNNKCVNYKFNSGNKIFYSCKNPNWPNGSWWGNIKNNSVNGNNITENNYVNKCGKNKTYWNFTNFTFKPINTINPLECKIMCAKDKGCQSYLINSGDNSCYHYKFNKNSDLSYQCNKSFDGGLLFGDVKSGQNKITLFKPSIKYNTFYYLKNHHGNTSFLASCGYSNTCRSYGNQALATFRPYDSYISSYPKWSRWKFVNKDPNLKRTYLRFNDIVTIRFEANNYYIVSCDYKRCNSYGLLDVSISPYKGKNNVFSGNAQYWKIVSSEGKTGMVGMNDKIRLLNMWGPTSYLNVCYISPYCGRGKMYAINTCKLNTTDSRITTSLWSIEDNARGTLLINSKRKGLYQNPNAFNQLLRNQKLPFYILFLNPNSSNYNHRMIVYKRLTSVNNINMYDLFTRNWFNSQRGVRNNLNVDFKLFSNIDDAKYNRNQWNHCNYNDPGVGFPRDCGKDRLVGGQWIGRGGRLYNWQNWSLTLV